MIGFEMQSDRATKQSTLFYKNLNVKLRKRSSTPLVSVSILHIGVVQAKARALFKSDSCSN